MDVLNGNTWNGTVYTWATIGDTPLQIGFLIDRLTVLMMVVVTFVSLMVHVYTIGYMAEDPGYQRFFSYISLFTFSMLMLVMANNFLQLFFGWEAVGPGVLPADRLLVHAADGDLRQPEGVPRQPRRRLRLPAGHRPDPGAASARSTMRPYFRKPLQMQDRHHPDLHPAVRRRDGQERAVPAARLAARFDGRPDADLGADPRRDHGDRGHLHGRAHVAAVRIESKPRDRWSW